MAYDVRLSELAIFDIESIASYLDFHWSENVKMNFLVDVSEKLILLETLPFIYRKSLSRPVIRECVVNKHVLMYYTVDEVEKAVFILALKNTKQTQ